MSESYIPCIQYRVFLKQFSSSPLLVILGNTNSHVFNSSGYNKMAGLVPHPQQFTTCVQLSSDNI